MRRMLWKRLWLPGVLVVFAAAPLTLSGASHSKPPAGPTPQERVLVAPLGYKPPGPFYLLSGRVFTTLDFIDAHHLLFTFHEPRLLQREATSTGKLESDQMIRAMVISLPGGEVTASEEWRMHDRSRYLWPIGAGKFLVRQRSTYLLTDASLQLNPYLEVPTTVLQTDVSPDGRILVVEHEYEKHTSVEHEHLQQQALQYGDTPPREDTQITLLDIASRKVMAAIRTELPIQVPISATGYVGAKKDDGDQFVLQFKPFEGKPVVLGKVASTCTPHETFLNEKALVIESCGPKSNDVFLDVWTTEGKKLWTAHRDGRQVWPTFAYTATGGRYAEGVLQVSHPIDLLDSLNDEDVHGQLIQVFDAATGTVLLATNASPILPAGENFALSPDGEQLAVLREGAIEVYKIPAASTIAQPVISKKKD